MSEVVATIGIQRFLKLFRLENGIRTYSYAEAFEKMSNLQASYLNIGYYRAIS